ncbi:hypothetical protein ACIGNX_25330 [Actinosynnema sp. NPDC053489]|uniref:hypothetical protein n=1 Tax=Actinosynnema sp. NPDC053489 TaxID=3363916 RepID=UPI0037CB7CA3
MTSDRYESEHRWPNEGSNLFAPDGDPWTMAYIHWSRDRWVGYVRGYREAADLLLAQVERHDKSADSLVYPFVMCWRHHVELQLKSVILQVQDYDRKPRGFLKSHKLDILWNSLRKSLRAIFPDENIENVERLLLQLQEVDPTSEHFRYPVTVNGEDTLTSLDRLPMREFHQEMEGLSNFFEGAATALYEMTSARNEYEAEMYEEARQYERDAWL